METRGANKQRELEEQIENLVTLLTEVKESQADQARRHEEQQIKLFDELCNSTQQQEQQLSRLASDHEKRLDSLKGDQLGIAETVGSLEKNSNSTISVLQDHI